MIFYVDCNFDILGHDNVVNSAMFSHDKALVVTSSDDKTAKIWTQSNTSPLLNFSNIKHNFQSEKVTSASDKVRFLTKPHAKLLLQMHYSHLE